MLGKMMTFRNLKTIGRVRDSSKVSECLVFTLFFMLAMALPVQANKLVVKNATFTDRNTTDHYGKIRFDISWDYSWRVSEAPVNWDAAWVFAKWKHKSGTEWFHCTLSTADHSTPHPQALKLMPHSRRIIMVTAYLSTATQTAKAQTTGTVWNSAGTT